MMVIGRIINYRYEVLEKIGDGRLFSVYRARDKVLNRLVALKVLSKDLCENHEFSASIAGGYQEVAALSHPNIARMLDADSTQEECIVATEYVRGTNVKDRIKRAGAIAVPLALDIIIPVLEALEYAHANHVVHGDIRAQDIIASPDGEIKLTDFGLSSALNRCPAVAENYQMRSIHYQAPEVVEGNSPSMASDIYSIGVVLYEMLTNTLPFDGSSAVSIALKKVKEAPTSPRSINAGVPKTLNDIVMKAIETSPGDRYASAAAMLADLRPIRDALRMGQAPHAPESHVMEREPAKSASGEPLKGPFWLMLGLFILVVLVSLGITMMVQVKDKEITVPPLLGKTWDEAQYDASQKGIELQDDGRVYSETYEAGKICSVVPPANSTVPRDNPVVRVKISNGPSMIEVPDLTGLSESAANEAAVQGGFMVGKIKEQYSDKVPPNNVVSQEPTAKMRRSPGSAIDLIISLGPKPVAEPPQEDTSTSNGTERRFNVAVEVPRDAEGPQDVVIKVNDDNGESIAYEAKHEPGDKFSKAVTTVGSNVRIRVYVGGTLISDSPY